MTAANATADSAPGTRRGGASAAPADRIASPEARADEAERLGGRKLGALSVAPLPVLELAGLEARPGHPQPMWNAEQLRVGELDARAGVAIVEQDFDPGIGELGVQAVGGGADTVGLLQIERNQHHLKGSDRVRPDDAALIVTLLDSRGHDTRHTDAVTAHVKRGLPPPLIEDQRFHRLTVVASELEDVADLYAARYLQAPAARGARIARHHHAQVGGCGARHVPVPVDAGEVLVLLVGAAYE